jgi:hypothetical protein
MSESSKRSRARDDGAPDTGVVTSAVAGGQSVPASHTIAPEGPTVEDVQSAAVLGGTVTSSLPVGVEQVERTDELGRLDVPTSAPSGAPAGSTWGDPTVDRQPSQLNETDAGPSLAYVVTWGKAAVHVDASKAQTRTGDDGDELFVTVASSVGSRDVVLEGQQVTLERGEALPAEAVPGQGAFLASIGGAIAVSVPPPAAN